MCPDRTPEFYSSKDDENRWGKTEYDKYSEKDDDH